MFLYTTTILLFLQHKTQKTQRQSGNFCKVFSMRPLLFGPQKRYLLTCLITVLKDRLNLSLNDPICHHFKLFLVQLYVSHNLEKKEKMRKKVALSIHSYFIIIIQTYLLCQFFKSSKKQNEIDFDCFLILKVLHKVRRL